MDATSVKQGTPATVGVQAIGGQRFEGKVTRTAWALDRTARTLRTEIDLPNPDGTLRPGMYAYGSIVIAEHTNTLTIPASALVKQADKVFCCCVIGNKITRKPIRTGLVDASSAEVTSGLDGTEDVVKASAGSLTDGQSVQVKVAAPKAAAK
jgi:RND family efflux transporter MFP subunit